METKRVTADFASRSVISFSGDLIRGHLNAIETNFKACNNILSGAGMNEIDYVFQPEEIGKVADIIPILTAYVSSVPSQAESELDEPLTADFQNKVLPALTDIVIGDIRTSGSSVEAHGDVDSIGNTNDKQVIREIGFDSFLNISNCMSMEDMQSPENVRAMDIFINLFREEFEGQMKDGIRGLDGNSIISLEKLGVGIDVNAEEVMKVYEGNEHLQKVVADIASCILISATTVSSMLTTLEIAEKATACKNIGKVLLLPEPGEIITVSKGIEANNKPAIVFSHNAWSTEYSIEKCNRDFKSTDKCRIRLNYAVENYECNRNDNDLLMFNLEGYDEPVFAGAMVDGYADIGDIVHVTLEDDNSFNFLILDTKNIQHTVEELAKENQCQCEWGHGYFREPIGDTSVVQLQVCEFILAGDCTEDSAINTESGTFLTKHRVVKTQIIDHILIKDEYDGMD